MSDLINRLVEQFKSKSQYDHFVRDSQNKFDINTYRFQHLTQAMARKGYNQLKDKYEKQQIEISPRSWHENQRKLFVWFLLALFKNLKDNNHKLEQQHWETLSQTFFQKDILFLKYQYNAIQKNRKRYQWTEQEDEILKSCEKQIQQTNWNQIAKQIFFKTESKFFKSSKQCRERWQNHLNDRVKKQQWSSEQDLLILQYVQQNGKKWSKIVEQLKNTRTQHMVKNRFKSLMAKGQIDMKGEQKNQFTEEEMIKYLINQTVAKNGYIDKKSSIQNASQAKDKVQQDFPPDIKLNGLKKSMVYYGVMERGQNGQFAETLTARSSPVPYLFQCRSPATVSMNNSHIYTIFTPQSGSTSTVFDSIGSNFVSCHENFNKKLLTKPSNCSQNSNTTKKYFDCSRNSDNINFSMEYDALQNGTKVLQVSTPIMKYAQQNINSFLFGNDNKFYSNEKTQNLIQNFDSSLDPKQLNTRGKSLLQTENPPDKNT